MPSCVVWLNGHPRPGGAVYAALGLVWIAVDLNHEPVRLALPCLVHSYGHHLFDRASLSVDGSTVTVPTWWGGRQLRAQDVAAVEIPGSVWPISARWVALRNEERLILRGADRDRARQIADELAVTVVRLQEG